MPGGYAGDFSWKALFIASGTSQDVFQACSRFGGLQFTGTQTGAVKVFDSPGNAANGNPIWETIATQGAGQSLPSAYGIEVDNGGICLTFGAATVGDIIVLYRT